MTLIRSEKFWPNPAQESLLKAVLLKGEAGSRALREWQAFYESGLPLDTASLHLLPLLYRRYHEKTGSKELIEKCREVHLAAAKQTLRLFAEGKNVIGLFSQKGIPTLFLKGAVLAEAYYHEHGLRPMSDLDVLVPEERAAEALDLLRKKGWEPEDPRKRNLPAEELVYFLHGLNLKKKGSPSLDLHWNILAGYRRPEAEREMRARAVPFRLQGESSLSLCGEDHFFLVCIHGLSIKSTAPIRWIADALQFVDEASRRGGFDWSRVSALAAQYRLNLKTLRALEYLKECFEVPVPEKVLEGLRLAVPSQMELMDYLLSAYGSDCPENPFSQIRIFKTPRVLWRGYCMRLWRMERGGRSGVCRLKGFLRYMLFYLGKKHRALLPLYLAREFVRKPRLLFP